MNDHLWIHEHAAAYVTGGLDADERRRFDAHLAQCAECRAAVEKCADADRELNDLFRAAAPPAGFEDRIIRRLQATRSSKIQLNANPFVLRIATGIAAVILLGGFGYVATQIVTQNDRYAASMQSADYGLMSQASGSGYRLSDRTIDRKNLGRTTRGVAVSSVGGVPENQPHDVNAPVEVELDQRTHAMLMNPVNWPAITGAEDSVSLPTDDSADAKGEKLGVDIELSRLGKHKGGDALGRQMASQGKPKVDTWFFQPTDLFARAQPDLYLKPSDETRVSGGGGQGGQDAPLNDRVPPARPEPETAPNVATALGVEPSDPPVTTPVPVPDNRKIIRNGEMEFEVESFDAGFMQIAKIVAEEGGFVATTSSEKLPNGKTKGMVVVRVAPERLDVLLLKLRALGDLKSQRIGAQDVTKQYTDLESELRAARAMEERLLEIIKTGKGEIKDLLEAEKQLGVWREKIEKVEGEIRYYNNLISLSTLSITLVEKDIKTAAAAFENENVNAGVETEDVETSRAETIKVIEEANGRVIESVLNQYDAGQLAAKIVADVPPDAAGPIIDRLKQLGKVARLDIDRKQSTIDGGPVPAGVHVEKKETRFAISLYNLANIAPRETVNLDLAAEDVEKAYNQILKQVQAAEGRIVTSNLSQQKADQATATVQFEVSTSSADAALAQTRAVGEVMRLAVAQNPDQQNSTAAKRGFVVQLYAQSGVAPRETITMQAAAQDVRAAYQALLEAARAAGARVLLSQLNESDERNVTGDLHFDIRQDDRAAIEKALDGHAAVFARTAGRSSDLVNTLESKLRVQVSFVNVDQIPPRETTKLSVEVSDVERAKAGVIGAAETAGGRVSSSTLNKSSSGQVVARLSIDVPLGGAAGVFDKIQSSGTVHMIEASRNTDVAENALSRARFDVTLSTVDPIIARGSGFWASIRQGLATSAAGLMWSLQLIVIGLCFVLPWVLAIWIIWKIVRRRRASAA